MVAAQAVTTLTALDVVTLTLWGEARNQPIEGVIAVGCVIRNRVNDPQWWGTDYISVCRKPKQFSCWNSGVDPNHRAVMALVDRVQRGEAIVDPSYDECRWVADGIMRGMLRDRTTATHYHAVGVAPAWAKKAKLLERIGDHLFYDHV